MVLLLDVIKSPHFQANHFGFRILTGLLNQPNSAVSTSFCSNQYCSFGQSMRFFIGLRFIPPICQL